MKKLLVLGCTFSKNKGNVSITTPLGVTIFANRKKTAKKLAFNLMGGK